MDQAWGAYGTAAYGPAPAWPQYPWPMTAGMAVPVPHSPGVAPVSHDPRFFGPDGDPTAFRIGGKLDKGSFGTVMECRRRTAPGEKLAVKVLDVPELLFGARDREKSMKRLNTEIRSLQTLRHDNIVQLASNGVVWSGDRLYLVMELVKGGPLCNVLQRHGRLAECSAKHVFKQLASALQYIHSESIIHRDLKPENVLVVDEVSDPAQLFSVKITDFGCSKMVSKSIATSRVGTPQYMAPEVEGSCKYDFAADLWSLGAVTYVLVESKFPFGQGSAESKEDFLYARDSSSSREVQDLVRRLLKWVPAQRLPLEDCLRHPWIVGGWLATLLMEVLSQPERWRQATDWAQQAGVTRPGDLQARLAAFVKDMDLKNLEKKRLLKCLESLCPPQPEVVQQHHAADWSDWVAALLQDVFGGDVPPALLLLARDWVQQAGLTEPSGIRARLEDFAEALQLDPLGRERLLRCLNERLVQQPEMAEGSHEEGDGGDWLTPLLAREKSVQGKDLLDAARTWVQQQDITGPQALRDRFEEFAAALELKPLVKKRVLDRLGQH